MFQSKYSRKLDSDSNFPVIYKLMDEFGDNLLEKNIRRYLGKNVVNDGIAETLLDTD